MFALYIITNDRNYLTIDNNQNLIACSNIDKAKKFTKEKVDNVLNNLPKPLKNLGYKSKLLYDLTDDFEHIYNTDTNVLLNEIDSTFKKFEEYFSKLIVIRDSLGDELSKIDLEIEDILHSIEFYNVNAYQGYKLYKLIQEKRIKRRRIKNFLEVVGYIENKDIKDILSSNISKTINGITDRKYTPRQLQELFKEDK